MARPQTDIEAGRQELLDIVEGMIAKRGAVDITVNELAAEAGMSPSNLYRFFENKEAILEAAAERWFAPKIAIMEEVVASPLPAREKLYQFFVKRYRLSCEQFEADPRQFQSYMELGAQHFEVVRGYVDFGDHYLAIVVAEAMEQGHFVGLTIDETVSLINQMVHVYCNPEVLVFLAHRMSEDKLAKIIDAIFRGLGEASEDTGEVAPMKLVS